MKERKGQNRTVRRDSLISISGIPEQSSTESESFFNRRPELVFRVVSEGAKKFTPTLDEDRFALQIQNNIRLARNLQSGDVFPVLLRPKKQTGMRVPTGRVRGREGLGIQAEKRAIEKAGEYAAARPSIVARIAMLEQTLDFADKDLRYKISPAQRAKIEGRIAFLKTAKAANTFFTDINLIELDAYEGAASEKPFPFGPDAPKTAYDRLVEMAAGVLPTSPAVHELTGSRLAGEVRIREDAGEVWVSGEVERETFQQVSHYAGQALKFGALAGGAIFLSTQIAGCSFPINAETGEPVEPTEIELLETPTQEEIKISELEATPTSVVAVVGQPYPESEAGFLIGAGGLENAEQRIRELGAGDDIEIMKGMIIAEMNRTGINPETIDWIFGINEQAEEPSWTMMAKDRNSGKFYWPQLTQGSEAGLFERSGNLAKHLNREIGDDFFDLVKLENPRGFEGAKQKLIADKSGWWSIGALSQEDEFVAWFNADWYEWRPVAEANDQEGIVMENNLEYQRVENGNLAELFPNSEIWKAERGDVVIINKETGIRLAGQTVETKYGNYTILLSDSHYQYQIKHLLSEENLNINTVLSKYPEDWVNNPRFKEEILNEVSNLASLKGFSEENHSIGGYPNIVDNPYKEEIVRIISTLIELKEKKIGFGIDLATYEPQPRDFIAIFMMPGNTIPLANSLPEGYINPNNIKRYSQVDFGFPTFKTEDGTSILIRLWFGGGVRLPEDPESYFYSVFHKYIEYSWFPLMDETAEVYGITEAHYSRGQFAPLFSKPEIYNSLTAFSNLSPIQPPYSWEDYLKQEEWHRFGLSGAVEVDLSKFE